MLTTIETIDDINKFWTWLNSQPFVAVDTETTGIDTFAPDFHIRLAQVGNTSHAWVFDFQRWRGVIEEMFDKYDGIIVMHNAKYDVHAFAAENVRVPWHSLHDTMIALRLAEPDKSAALKNAADRHIGVGSSGSQQDLSEAMRVNKWDWATVPLDFPTYVMYAGLDVVLTSRLYESPALQAGFNSPVYAMEMEVRELANTMERNGLKIDRDYSSQMSCELRHEANALREQVVEDYGFSATSTSQLGRWMLTNAPGMITKTTDAGAPATDKETLEHIATHAEPHVADLARRVLRIRRTEKLASSYFDNFVELSDSNDIVHAEIETLAARTGRMSIRKPGLQTLPRVGSDPETRLVRRAVIPRQEGHALLSCDSDQIELRLAAALAEDSAMIEAFITSDDFFTTLMREIYSDPSAQKSDPRRAAVKTTMYAKTYGAGPSKIALSAGVSEQRIKELLSGMATAYPDYNRLGERYEREARENDGWVTNPYGRRLKVDEGREYTATNYVIQSAAADVLKKSLVDLGHAGLEDYLVIPVHDELVLSVPEDEAEEIKRVVETVMTCDDFALTLTASAGDPATTWADAK